MKKISTILRDAIYLIDKYFSMMQKSCYLSKQKLTKQKSLNDTVCCRWLLKWISFSENKQELI